MDKKIEVPIVANIVDVKGLDKIIQGTSKAYQKALSQQIAEQSAIQQTASQKAAVARARMLLWEEKKETEHRNEMIARYRAEVIRQEKAMREAERLESKKANLLRFVGRQAEVSHQLSQRMIRLSAGGLAPEDQQQYLNAAVANRAAYRALTGRDITGMMTAAGRATIHGGQEFLNREINKVRAQYKAGPDAEEATSAWNEFIARDIFGGDPEAYFNNRSIDRRERIYEARQALALAQRAYGTRLRAGMVQPGEKADYLETRDFLRRFINTQERIEKNTSALVTGWKTINAWLAAGAGGVALGTYASNTLASIYGNTKDPFRQTLHTVANIEQGVGGSLGAILGGALGTAIAGPIGTAVGAAVGGALGSFLGGQQKRELTRAEAAQQEAITRLRYQALYGGRGNQTWARLVEAQTGGMVSAGTVESVVSNAESFQAAAAFGKVSDDQWIALSNMPNLFAALQTGADEQTIFEAYRKDIRALPNGLGKMFTQMLGMGFDENTRAWAKTDVMWRGTSATRGYAEGIERRYLETDPAFAAEVADRGFQDIKMREVLYRDATRAPGRFKYRGTPWAYSRGELDAADIARLVLTGEIRPDLNGVRELVKPTQELSGISPLLNPAALPPEKSNVRAEINVVVNNEKTKIGTVWVEEEELAQLQNFVIGAI